MQWVADHFNLVCWFSMMDSRVIIADYRSTRPPRGNWVVWWNFKIVVNAYSQLW